MLPSALPERLAGLLPAAEAAALRATGGHRTTRRLRRRFGGVKGGAPSTHLFDALCPGASNFGGCRTFRGVEGEHQKQNRCVFVGGGLSGVQLKKNAIRPGSLNFRVLLL